MTALVLLALGVHDLAAVAPGPGARRPWVRLVAAVAAATAGALALLVSGAGLPVTLAALATALGAAGVWHALAPVRRPVWRTAAVGAVDEVHGRELGPDEGAGDGVHGLAFPWCHSEKLRNEKPG